jgi:hypothetical protein
MGIWIRDVGRQVFKTVERSEIASNARWEARYNSRR